MVNILTDSCSDLSPELISHYNIDVIRLSVFLDDRIFKDGLDLSLGQLFDLVNKTMKLPKTSAPSITEFSEIYKALSDDIVFVGISSQLSATLANAHQAEKDFPDKKIHIVDSLNLSTGIGLLAVKAAELRDQGLAGQEISQEIQRLIPKIHTSFVIESLEFLYKGGRCTALQNIMGSLLRIRPIIEVKLDGTLGIREKTRGSRKKALISILDEFRSNLSTLDPLRVFVTHTGCEEDASYLANEITQLAHIENVCITHAGATIASHCGPDTIGIIYMTK